MSRGEKLSVLGLYHWDDSLFSEMVYPSQFTEAMKDIFVGNVLLECAELECIFPDWGVMKKGIGYWSKLNLSTWERIYNASLLEYNPIENYNRTEIETIESEKSETHSGNDVNRATGTDSVATTGSDQLAHGMTNTHETLSGTLVTANSGTDTATHKVTAYDANAFKDHDKTETVNGLTQTSTDTRKTRDTAGGNDTTTYGRTDTTTHGKTDTFTHGEQIDNDDTIERTNHTTGNIGVTTSQQMLQQEIDIAPALNVLDIMVQSFKNRFCLLVY